MSDKNGSANTAILAIFVLVLLAMIGFFMLQQDQPDKKFELEVKVPEIEETTKP